MFTFSKAKNDNNWRIIIICFGCLSAWHFLLHIKVRQTPVRGCFLRNGILQSHTGTGIDGSVLKEQQRFGHMPAKGPLFRVPWMFIPGFVSHHDTYFPLKQNRLFVSIVSPLLSFTAKHNRLKWGKIKKKNRLKYFLFFSPQWKLYWQFFVCEHTHTNI